MKKIITSILTVLVIAVLAIGLVACDKGDDSANSKALTAQEAEEFLFGTDGAVNHANKAFNVKGEISASNSNYTSKRVVCLVLDENNEKIVYVNGTTVDNTVDGSSPENVTHFMYHAWSERSNGTLKDEGVKYITTNDDGSFDVSDITDNASAQNGIVANCGLHGPRKYIAEEIHNSNRDVYDTITYSATAYYTDSTQTTISKIEITMTYYYFDGDQRIDGTSTMVLEVKEYTLANGTKESGLVFTSISTTESDNDTTTATYTYGVDNIDLPDFNDPGANWPDPVEL